MPVDAESWSRDPFGGDLVDGVVWGRGAVDMKDMVAMELAVMLALKRSGADLRRDVIFAAVADEEAGGEHGARGLVARRPELFGDAAGRPAAAALNEVGGYSDHRSTGGASTRSRSPRRASAGPGFAPAERPATARCRTRDNAAVKLATAVNALAADQARRPARVVPVVAGFLEALGLGEVARLAEDDPAAAASLLAATVDDPVLRRSLDAMLRDTVTPTVLRSGKKVNVLPGSGEAEIDVRTLPGTDQAALLSDLQRGRRR